MGNCSSDNNRRRRKKKKVSEKKFGSEITSKKSLDNFKIRISDFVVQNKNNIASEYKLLSPPIGQGGYGEVRKAIHLKSNTYRAIKILKKKVFDKKETVKILKEINILKGMDHPHTVKIYEFFETDSLYYIVMEFLEGEELFSKLISEDFQYSEYNICKVIYQLLFALKCIHSNGIMHRDIKSENIMHDGKNIVLIDFGNSKNIESDKRNKELTGTSFYIAPEVIKGRYNEKCDIWSTGVLLYLMLTGEPPFEGKSYQIYQNIQDQKFKIPIKDLTNTSKEAKDLLKQMFVYDYEVRKGADKLLEHEWFNLLKEEKINKKKLRKIAANMEKFQFKNKLQEAFFMYLTNSLVTKKECEELIEVFDTMDDNKDGVLSKEELYKGFEKVGKIGNKEEFEEVFNDVDKDGDGKVSFGEYLAASVDKKKVLSEERILSVFKLFDMDKNGKIDLYEFSEVFQHNDEILVENWKDMLTDVDTNGDGNIDFEEFRVLMLKLVNKDIEMRK